MHALKKTLAALIVLTAVQTTATAAEASSRPRVDLNAYCQKHYGADARLREYKATAWHCYKPGKSWGISVNQAYQEQHRLPKARYSSNSDPYSWYCYRPAPPAPGVDLTRYCKKRFGQGAYAKLVGGTALDWVCSAGKHDRWGISVSTACREQHGLAKASYKNRSDPYSWFCHR